MGIKIKFRFDGNNYNDARIPCLAFILLIISAGFMSIDIYFENSRSSVFSLSTKNMTDSRMTCNIPFDECRCSVLSNKSNDSIKCITDIEAMAGHILPLVSYLLQLYLIYELISFTGSYSHILTDIYRIIALFVFIVIAIGAHGSSCFHSKTMRFVQTTGLLISCPIMCLFFRSEERRRSRAAGHNPHNRENTITFTVHADIGN